MVFFSPLQSIFLTIKSSYDNSKQKKYIKYFQVSSGEARRRTGGFYKSMVQSNPQPKFLKDRIVKKLFVKLPEQGDININVALEEDDDLFHFKGNTTIVMLKNM